MIKTIEEMQKIVDKFDDLSWVGWDVIELKYSPSAVTNVKGVFHNNKWYIKNTFVVSKDGWDIPKKYVVNNEK